MSAFNESGQMSFTAGEDLAAHRRVKRGSAGEVVYADASDGNNWIGVTIHAKVSGRQVTVRLRNSPGSFFFTADSAIADNLQLKVANDGKVNNAEEGAAAIPFSSNEAATADGDVIETVPTNAGLVDPIAVVLTSTNGTAAGAADLAALKTEAEKIGDDVRAIHAALVAAGLMTAS